MSVNFINIAETIEKDILEGKYIDTIPSINTLSATFNVCPATIKRVISQLRDWDLIAGEQGRCNRINPKASGNLYFHKNVVIFANLVVISNSFYIKVIQNLSKALEEKFICLHLFISEDQLKECGFEPDCIVVVGQKISKQLNQYCPNNKIIKVNLPEHGYHGIATDNRKAGFEAIRSLAEDYGHKNIGMVATQLKYDFGCFYLRYLGAMDYIKVNPNIQFSVVELDENLDNIVNQQHIIEKFLVDNPNLTAIFASCDLYAAAIYNIAQKNQLRIPEDLSILAFGEQSFTRLLNPPLSTFLESSEDISKNLIRLVMEILISPNCPIQNTFISPQKLLRGSLKKYAKVTKK